MEKEPSTRPGNQLDSVLKLTHVDQITQDLAAVLKEIHESINSSDGNVRDCSARLKSYIKISLKAVERIHREKEESIKLTGNRKFSQEKQSRDRADFRNAEKRADRLSGKESKKRKSEPLRRLEQNVLGKNALNDGTKRAKRDLPTRKQKKRATAVADLGDLPRPQNGEIYTLKELVSLMCIDESSSIFRKSVTSVYNMLYAKCEIVCDYRTLARAIKTYKDTGLLPRHGSEGSRMGRPPLVATNQIHVLNEDVKKHTSKVESARELSGKIVELNTFAVGDEECGYEIVSPPSQSTLKTYHYLASAEKGITLTSKSGSRPQGARRQAAGTSLRNLMSHVCTVAETHFVEGSFEEPTGLSSGAKKMLALVKSVTGVPHRPIKPYQVLNFDFSSYFTWKGTVTEKEGTSNEWVRVSTKTLARGVRNRRGPFRDSEETKCNGLTVKWCDGAAASGHIFPMVALFSGFSEEELPKDSFLVLEVPGMNINANLDVRMADTHVRYICLKRTDVSMERFFEWYEEEIIYPMVSELRRAHSLLELHSEGAPVPLSKAARVWADSDMGHIKRISNIDVMDRNMKRGVLYNKIGAKYTAVAQPMDVGDGFKVKKSVARRTTCENKDSPLKQTLENGLSKLIGQGRLVLATKKREALLDCGATAPEVHGRAYTRSKIQNAWIDSGYLDKGSLSCPDLYGMMKSSHLDFQADPKLKKLFLDNVKVCMEEMKSNGEISEAFYENIGFPEDEDCAGNTWKLTRQADVFRRSKPLYSASIWQRKKDALAAEVQKKEAERNARLEDAQAQLERNRECEKKILTHLDEGTDSSFSETLSGVSDLDKTLRAIAKPTSKLLESFVRTRKFEDPTEAWKVPRKGTVAEAKSVILASSGSTSLQTVNNKGLSLVELTYELRLFKPIAKIPELPPVHIPKVIIPEPSVVRFSTTQSLEAFQATEDWCRRAFACTPSLSDKGLDNIEQHLRNSTNLHARSQLASKHHFSRLPMYLESRLPSANARQDLQPGSHFTWSSFCDKSARITTLMVLQNQIVNCIEYVEDDESMLVSPNQFQHVTGDFSNKSGAYLVEDSSRNMILRAGMAEGFLSRWTGHETASKLSDAKNGRSRFYRSYPHESVASGFPSRKGTFQELNQLVGVAFDSSKKEEAVGLFNWSEREIEELKKLKLPGSRDSLIDRQFRHLCYLFELAFALSIEPRRNISSNPGCEWQLRWYGKE